MKNLARLARFLALFGFAASPAVAGRAVVWPDLPKTGFLSGRPATVEDAKQGNAVFSMNGESAGILSVDIPQYVLWSDEHGDRHPMILVQAELAPGGSQIVGLRDFAGQDTVATLPELELLGTKKPN